MSGEKDISGQSIKFLCFLDLISPRPVLFCCVTGYTAMSLAHKNAGMSPICTFASSLWCRLWLVSGPHKLSSRVFPNNSVIFHCSCSRWQADEMNSCCSPDFLHPRNPLRDLGACPWELYCRVLAQPFKASVKHRSHRFYQWRWDLWVD